MSAQNDGGPAFPTVPKNHGYDESQGTGSGPEMTLRDWFAGKENLSEWDDQEAIPSKSMIEALAGYPQPTHGWSCSTQSEWIAMLTWEADWRSALKYIRADAMLKARNK
jgi:hypothetical protein